MAVVYNYFKPIPIPDPENPKFKIQFENPKFNPKSPESAKHVQSPKKSGKGKREKHR